MRKLVVAGVLCLAAMTASERSASALSLFGMHLGGSDARQAPVVAGQQPRSQAPVVLAQSSDAEVRLQQLEDQMRQLNGRIEEMSYQLLQMQEQIRKGQEDNEFRFQQLEKKGGGGGGGTTTIGGGAMKKSEADVPAASGGGQVDDVAKVIQAPSNSSDMTAAPSLKNNNLGQPPAQLGSIQIDKSGNAVGATANPKAVSGAGAAPAATGGNAQTAALGSEADSYKAAYGHVLSGDYGLAEQEFRSYIGTYPSSARAADANFWLGEALYSQGKYNDAAKTFLNAHQKYGNSEKAPEMLLKLGMSLAALDNKDTACATLHEVTKRYPKASKAVATKVASEEKRLAC